MGAEMNLRATIEKPGCAGLKGPQSASADFEEVAREFIPAQEDRAMQRLYAILIYLALSSPLMAQETPGMIMSISIPRSALTVDMRGNIYDSRSVYFPDGSYKDFLSPDPQVTAKTRDFGDGFSAASSGFARAGQPLEGVTSYFSTFGIKVDLDGTIYIAAGSDQRVRRIDQNGIIWTAAGSSVREFPSTYPRDPEIVRGGFSGDGGPAIQAQLNNPADVALDAQGNLYIADCGNGRIRMVNREGFISTFAGNGASQTSPLGDGGPAILAMLYAPLSLAVDLKGNVYVAEPFAHRVRKIASDDQHTITTFAGTGQAGYSGDGGPATRARLNLPGSIAVDVVGNVYIADFQNKRVRMVDTNGIITTFAGNGSGDGLGPLGDGGPATQARIEYPTKVVVDAKGYVYISAYTPQSGIPLRRVSPIKPFEIPSIRLGATSVSFVTTSVNTPVDQPFTISNVGKETPLLAEFVTDKYVPGFKVFPDHVIVQPGGSQTVTVRYTSTELRSTSSTLSVYHSGAENKPLTVRLNAIPGTTKSADFDGDGKVGFDDFFLFAAAFGLNGTGDNAKFDLDGSGKIDFDDFFLFAGKFGR